MSYNLLCVPGPIQGRQTDILPAALPPLVDPATDFLFTGTPEECAEYEGSLREVGHVVEVVGTHRSICERRHGARNI